jgi:hypothetical protein
MINHQSKCAPKPKKKENKKKTVQKKNEPTDRWASGERSRMHRAVSRQRVSSARHRGPRWVSSAGNPHRARARHAAGHRASKVALSNGRMIFFFFFFFNFESEV